MTSEQKRKLNEHLSSLDRHETEALFRRAAELRKRTSRVKRPRIRFVIDAEDEIPPPPTRLQDLDEFIWKLLNLEGGVQTVTGDVGTVLTVSRRNAMVVLGGVTTDCLLTAEVAALSEGLAIGDDAVVQIRDRQPWVVGIRPRRTHLSRPNVMNATVGQIIVANVDTVVVVASVVSPPLHVRILDRYLISIHRGGSRAVIAINKLDLLSEEDQKLELAQLAPYAALGVPIHRCSAEAGIGIGTLRAELAGQLAAFVGHSGVGKSSLINAFKPELGLEVGSVSTGNARGAHTTTASTLLDLGDMRVIDTPGIRSFGLWQIRRSDLPWYFPEFALAGPCKYRDCSHTHEPRCAVKAAVEAGTLNAARYDNYLRIFETYG